MRLVDARTMQAWKSRLKTDEDRPIIEATLHKCRLRKVPYDVHYVPGGSKRGHGRFSTVVFGQLGVPHRLRGIRSFSWSRNVETDVAEATLELLNTETVALGEPFPTEVTDWERLGYMTPNRGEHATPYAQQRWGWGEGTGWEDRIIPDRIIRTYEGYGHTPGVEIYDDPRLYPSGVWMIDSVTYTAAGTINIKMRDVGRMLLDQIVLPPVVPFSEYPMRWEKAKNKVVPSRDAVNGSWQNPTFQSSSNTRFVGKRLPEDYPGPANNGNVEGHAPRHAFDNDKSTYWLSTGQVSRFSRAWIQGNFNTTQRIGAVRFKVRGGPYKVFVSIKGADGWIGRKRIPNRAATADVDIDANIPFVKQLIVDRGATFETVLPRVLEGKAIRLTFTDLWDRQPPYRWYAAASNIEAYVGDNVDIGRGERIGPVGNYHDFTDIVKWLCAFGGFYWPTRASGLAFFRAGNQYDYEEQRPVEDFRYFYYDQNDAVLPRGRVWGDFMNTGTAGEADLTEDIWDKKPLMDGISYIRDMTGFVFFIDEYGGIVWRMPNIWTLGNYLSSGEGNYRISRRRSKNILTIDEDVQLLDMSTTYSSTNIRERLFVANTGGSGKDKDPDGVVVEGYTPLNVAFRRTAGWTDQNFKGTRECKIMADMIAARQMFDYRQSQITIPANPAIQVDDQIRVIERVTGDTYYHYVKGISSQLNVESGEWTYTLDTHWLGEKPRDAWAIDVDVLDAATRNYLKLMGAV